MAETEEESSNKVFLYKEDTTDLPSDIVRLVPDASVRVFRNKQEIEGFRFLPLPNAKQSFHSIYRKKDR